MENLTCLRCGSEMALAYDRIDLGGDGWNLITSFLTESLVLSVWVCPKCGKVEFFSVIEQEPDSEDRVECPKCGAIHSKYINCPQCTAERGITSGFHGLGKQKVPEKKRRSKKNDVPWEL